MEQGEKRECKELGPVKLSLCRSESHDKMMLQEKEDFAGLKIYNRKEDKDPEKV